MRQHELCQDCSQHSWDQLGLGIAEGAKGWGGKGILYLSPRMAYWLSSCRCCIEAPPVSSLPRFLCFTTSKVFSISLSLKQSDVRQTTARLWPSHSPTISCLGRTYLRVSTCLAVESRDGNCASLKISGGAWLFTRLVVVSRAPGGRYTPGIFISGDTSSSSIAAKTEKHSSLQSSLSTTN